MFLFFLTSGLFLGWSLGANDAANIFGSAVGTKMVKFKSAVVIASVFVIIGAVLQGYGASQTLGDLGSINAIGGAFTVALCAGLTVFWMTKLQLPVSTSQGIMRVGGNRKGIFTRDRKPKSAAFLLKKRWTTMAFGEKPQQGESL